VHKTNRTYYAETYLKDHLGNIMAVFGNDGSGYGVMQTNTYYPFGMEILTLTENSTSPNNKNEYKYNGKMLQDELGLNWLDYGARFYDGVIGRFFCIDPLADSSFSWTPYRYAFDNPIKYIDPNGMFEIDKKTAEENPELVKYLKTMVTDWNNKSSDFKNAFYETSGLNEEQVIEMLTYGKGPKIEVANLDVEEDGECIQMNQGLTVSSRNTDGKQSNVNNGKGLIKLDKNNTVFFLENASTMGDKQAAITLVESTLYHEGTHYGNLKVNQNAHGKYSESGKVFENKAYGRDISKYNFINYWESRQVQPLKPRPAHVQ